MFLFQTAARRDGRLGGDLAFLDRLWADWSPGYDATADLGHAQACLRDPANLCGAGYYRAMFDASRRLDAYAAEQEGPAATGERPMLYLHGGADGCLNVGLVEGAEQAPPAGFAGRDRASDSGHFLHLEDSRYRQPVWTSTGSPDEPPSPRGRCCCRGTARLAGCIFRTGF